MSVFQQPKRQAILFTIVFAVLYLFVARPVETITDFVLVDKIAYLTAGHLGVRAVDYSNSVHPEQLSHLDTKAYAYALQVQDDYIYLAEGRKGLSILKISEQNELRRAANISASGLTQDVALGGKFVFVAEGDEGLRIFAMEKPDKLKEQKKFKIKGDVSLVVVEGKWLYLVDNNQELKIYQWYEDEAPKEKDSFDVEADIYDILVAPDTDQIYLAADNRGLVILDISNPEDITEVGSFETPGQAKGVALDTIYAYVADGQRGVSILDVSHPKDIQIAGEFDTWGNSSKIAVQEGMVYLADGVSGLRALVSSIMFYPEFEGATSQSATENIRKEKYLYLADGGRGVRVIDPTDITNLKEVNFFDTPGYAMGVFVKAGKAFVADRGDFLVFDVSHPEKAVKLLNKLEADGEADFQDVLVDDNNKYAYLAQGSYGFGVVDLSRSNKLEIIGEEEIAGEALDLDIYGKNVYVAGGTGGLSVVNVADPKKPTRLGTNFLMPGDAMAVAFARPASTDKALYVYVAAGPAGLCAVDVTYPEALQMGECVEMRGSAQDVYVVEKGGTRLAYVVDVVDGGGADADTGALYAFSLADPLHPVLVGMKGLGVPLHGIMVDGEYVYVAAFERGLRVVKTSADGKLFDFVATYDYPPEARSFALQGNFAYIVDGAGTDEGGHFGMRIVDVSDPKKPRETGVYRSAGHANYVKVSGNYAYIAEGEAGLQVVDITHSTMPKRMPAPDNQKARTGGDAMHLALNRNYLYLADSAAGLQIYDIADRGKPRWINALRVKEQLPGPVIWVETYGDDYLLAACEGFGLVSIQVTKPKEVQVLDAYRLESIRSFTVFDKFAMLAAGKDGLVIMNVSLPRRLEKEAEAPTIGIAAHVDYLYPYAFVANETDGFQVFYLSDATHPLSVESYSDAKNAKFIQVRDLPSNVEQSMDKKNKSNYRAYVADGVRGLQIFSSNRGYIWVQAGVFDLPGAAPLGELFHFAVNKVDQGWQTLNSKAEQAFFSDAIGPVIDVSKRLHKYLKKVAENSKISWPKVEPSKEKVGWTTRHVLMDLVGFGLVGMVLWLIFLAQYVLPVDRLGERLAAGARLAAYPFKGHGTLARVSDGKVTLSEHDDRRHGPGTVLVDMNSAVVLEKRILQRPFLLRLFSGSLFEKSNPQAPFGKSGGQPLAPLRVEGPGVVFTQGNQLLRNPKYDETILGVVDLRQQVRTSAEVRAATRDGIEVATKVFCVFSLGQSPEVLQVTYGENEDSAENLRVIRLVDDIQNGKLRSRYKVVKELGDELDDDDKLEIHNYVQQYRRVGLLPPISGNGGSLNGKPPGAPFVFNRERVLAAVTARAQGGQADMPAEWTGFPEQAATEVFRNILAQQVYDNLYRPTDPQKYPLSGLKSRFRARVRNLGILAYQFVERQDREPLRANFQWNTSRLNLYPAQSLSAPKVLRIRGIKIIGAGFIEMKPVDPEVRQKLLEYWLARWRKNADLTLADYDLRATRVRNQARVQAQRDMISSLNTIMSSGGSREALAIRIFQALETVAADPVTGQFVPFETIEMLKTLHQWLLPGGGNGWGGNGGSGLGLTSALPENVPPQATAGPENDWLSGG